MPTVTLPTIDQSETDVNTVVKQLINVYVQFTEEMTYLLSHLDTKNINEIDGDVLISGTVTAAKIMVDKLSAISADLGTIRSGEIYGTYIASRENAYPRAEMRATDSIFGAYASSGNSITMTPTSSPVGSPQLSISGGGNSTVLYQQSSNSLISSSGNLVLSASSDIDLQAGFLRSVNIPFDQLVDFGGLNTSLYQQLSSKVTKGTETGSAGPFNGGIPIGTQLMTAGGGTVTWVGIAAHSHTQN